MWLSNGVARVGEFTCVGAQRQAVTGAATQTAVRLDTESKLFAAVAHRSDCPTTDCEDFIFCAINSACFWLFEYHRNHSKEVRSTLYGICSVFRSSSATNVVVVRLLGLLLSDFQSTKALLFLNRLL